MSTATSLIRRLRSTAAATAAAPLGLPLTTPFRRSGPLHTATLDLDADAGLPGGTRLLRPGTQRSALVRAGALPLRSGGRVPTLAVRVVDAYGPGRHQDFLLASSGDGAPAHHMLLPAQRHGERLFSSLWLYLAGRTPVLFGVLPFADRIGAGAVLPFAISGPVGRFHRVGSLTLADPVSSGASAAVSMDATHDGGGLSALPPTRLYRERD